MRRNINLILASYRRNIQRYKDAGDTEKVRIQTALIARMEAELQPKGAK